MIKKLILLFLLFIVSVAQASEITTNYSFEIPSIADRNWQPILSKDIISMDKILGIMSEDIAVGGGLTETVTIISNDVGDLKTRQEIISNDVYDVRFEQDIISTDVGVLKTTQEIISTDVGVLNVVQGIISNDIADTVYKQNIISTDVNDILTDANYLGTSLTSSTNDIVSSTGTISFNDDNLITDGNITIDSDSSKLFLGEGQDASIYYDSGNLIIDPKVVGNGAISLNGGDLTAGIITADVLSCDGISADVISLREIRFPSDTPNNNDIMVYSSATGSMTFEPQGTTVEGAKAWVVFDGDDSDPITPDDSYNISGTITKSEIGVYEISWDTDFATSNYVVVGTANASNATPKMVSIITLKTGSSVVATYNLSGVSTDASTICITAFGDQ